MAIEKIILRPVNTILSLVPNSNAIYFPTDYDETKLHLLVSEKIADNDSTYIVAKGIGGTPGFSFSIPENYHNKIPTEIKVCGTGSSYDSTDSEEFLRITFPISYNSEEETTRTNVADCPTSFTLLNWTYFEIIIPMDDISGFYNYMIEYSDKYHLLPTCSSIAKNSSDGIAITQLYLELTYEEESSFETIYIKDNNSWSSIEGLIYKKQNGVWEKIDSSILQNSTKYQINNSNEL